jgi:CDP-paratose synthetase
MRILLTGPGGFLGSAIAHHWASRGHELCLLARPSSNLIRLEKLTGSFRVLRATTPAEIASAVTEAEPEAIVHTACSYGRRGEPVLALAEANIILGISLLEAALGVARRQERRISFINTGTSLAPEVSLYALSKRQFSAWGSALAAGAPRNLSFIDVRLQQMYGPGDDDSKFITQIIEACRRNHPRLALTAGEQKRDLIHIEDVVLAYDYILEARSRFAPHDVIEVGSGEAVEMKSFVELAKRLSGATTKLDFGAVPYRENEAMLCVAETGRLRSLGWIPRVSLEEGIRRMIAPTTSY